MSTQPRRRLPPKRQLSGLLTPELKDTSSLFGPLRQDVEVSPLSNPQLYRCIKYPVLSQIIAFLTGVSLTPRIPRPTNTLVRDVVGLAVFVATTAVFWINVAALATAYSLGSATPPLLLRLLSNVFLTLPLVWLFLGLLDSLLATENFYNSSRNVQAAPKGSYAPQWKPLVYRIVDTSTKLVCFRPMRRYALSRPGDQHSNQSVLEVLLDYAYATEATDPVNILLVFVVMLWGILVRAMVERQEDVTPFFEFVVGAENLGTMRLVYLILWLFSFSSLFAGILFVRLTSALTQHRVGTISRTIGKARAAAEGPFELSAVEAEGTVDVQKGAEQFASVVPQLDLLYRSVQYFTRSLGNSLFGTMISLVAACLTSLLAFVYMVTDAESADAQATVNLFGLIVPFPFFELFLALVYGGIMLLLGYYMALVSHDVASLPAVIGRASRAYMRKLADSAAILTHGHEVSLGDGRPRTATSGGDYDSTDFILEDWLNTTSYAIDAGKAVLSEEGTFTFGAWGKVFAALVLVVSICVRAPWLGSYPCED